MMNFLRTLSIGPNDAGQFLHWCLALASLALMVSHRRLSRRLAAVDARVSLIADTVDFPEGDSGGEDTGRVIAGTVPIPGNGGAAVDPSDPAEDLHGWRTVRRARGRLIPGEQN